jgi:acetoin utilization deacetylase AcuC-like enzyme
MGATALVAAGSLRPSLAQTTAPRAQRTAWVYDDAYLTPVFGTKHPEQPARVAGIAQAIRGSAMHARLTLLKPQATSAAMIDDAIKRMHTPAHVDALKARYDADVVALARLAVGGTIAAVDAVMAKRVHNAFVCSRPPGHHARNTGREEGFCFYNHVSIAARYAQRQHRARRVLIVDWDYHHGDGTEHLFYDDPSVLVFNTYDANAYPRVGDPARRGEGAGVGYNINVPLGCGTNDDAIERVFLQSLVPAADRFKPDLILISCGFDSRVDDLLGCFNISDQGFATLTKIVMDLAHRHAQGRVVSVLEGGYNLTGIASASLAHVQTLLDHRST